MTNLEFLWEACRWYKKRFGVETLFSDQKSQGFYLCHSHLSQSERLSGLLLATCPAHYWMVCLGAEVVRCGWNVAPIKAGACSSGSRFSPANDAAKTAQ